MRISDWSSDVCSSDLFFSPVLVRKADHRNLDYAGEFAQCVFDFAGVDIFPAPDDHFFQPTCNPQIAVRVQRAQIAGTQIAFSVECGARGTHIVELAARHEWLRSEERRVGKEWVKYV